MTNEPVQVVLNPTAIRTDREPNHPVDNGTDFFKGRNEAFQQHRDRLAATLRLLADELSTPGYRAGFGGLGHVKVFMNERAIAKSHRPQQALFREKIAPHVATDHIGEPIYAVTAESLKEIIATVEAAEVVVKDKTNQKTGEIKPYPTRQRVEVSAIERVQLWSEADKRSFSAEDGAAWLAGSSTGGSYLVEMFPQAVAASNPNLANAEKLAAARFVDDMGTLSVQSEPIKSGIPAAAMAIVRVIDPGAKELLAVERAENGTAASKVVAVYPDPVAHQEVLAVIAANPLVRAIHLPPVVRSADTMPVTEVGDASDDVFDAFEAETLGKVGVIDGGVGGPINNWVVERWGQLADQDQDLAHGTFITGLLVAGSALNTYLSPTGIGCQIYDVDVLPRDADASSRLFASYYPNGISDFMDEVESAVESFRENHNVRVFNFSMNISSPTRSAYGYTSRRLDEIARRLDVIFVISAGNLTTATQRPEWHHDPATALADLNADIEGFLGEPGQSLYNMSVSALNPPGLANQQPFALSRYSRRGPGLRGATKPDFAHIGGSGTPSPTVGSNLVSVSETGQLYASAGTSYAAPLVARQLADLDAAVDGNLSRETLLALMVHHASRPQIMTHRLIAPSAKDLVGFGMPATAQEMLEGDDSQITLVIADFLQPKGEATFEFPWPPSLVENGKCRGSAKLTLVTQPTIAYEHGDERVRLNVGASLRQQQESGGFRNKLSPVGVKRPATQHATEKDLLAEAMKWQMVKSFEFNWKKPHVGRTLWQFSVEYLTRAGEDFPLSGVPFAAVLTIGDPDGKAPVFQEMRQTLSGLGLRTADIRAQVQPRATI